MKLAFFAVVVVAAFVSACTTPNADGLFETSLCETGYTGTPPHCTIASAEHSSGSTSSSTTVASSSSSMGGSSGMGGSGGAGRDSGTASVTGGTTGAGGDVNSSSSAGGNDAGQPFVATCNANCPVGYSLLAVENSPGACGTATTCAEGADRVSVCVQATLSASGGCSPCQTGEMSLGELSPACSCGTFYVCSN